MGDWGTDRLEVEVGERVKSAEFVITPSCYAMVRSRLPVFPRHVRVTSPKRAIPCRAVSLTSVGSTWRT